MSRRGRELERDQRLEREGRESKSRRSNWSPKRSRRDGDPIFERIHGCRNCDMQGSHPDDKEKNLHKSQKDVLPMEDLPILQDTRFDISSKVVVKKIDGPTDGTKLSSVSIEATKSQYSQNYKSGSAGRDNQSSQPRASDNRKWTSRSEQLGYETREEWHKHRENSDKRDPTEQSNARRHDGFFELEADIPLARKRPSFRENKMNLDPSAPINGAENTRLPFSENQLQVSYSLRREGRGFSFRRRDRPYNQTPGDEWHIRRRDGSYGRDPRAEADPYRVRNFRGRDRFSASYGGERSIHQNPRATGNLEIEKWKHDLFDDANRSPTPRNDDEEIARVEALLAS